MGRKNCNKGIQLTDFNYILNGKKQNNKNEKTIKKYNEG